MSRKIALIGANTLFLLAAMSAASSSSSASNVKFDPAESDEPLDRSPYPQKIKGRTYPSRPPKTLRK